MSEEHLILGRDWRPTVADISGLIEHASNCNTYLQERLTLGPAP